MASEQTPREVIADALLKYSSGGGTLADVLVGDVERDLDAAGFAIVRKPTGDQVTAAVCAFWDNPDPEYYPWSIERMAAALAALAAAEAAGGYGSDWTEEEKAKLEESLAPDSCKHEIWSPHCDEGCCL